MARCLIRHCYYQEWELAGRGGDGPRLLGHLACQDSERFDFLNFEHAECLTNEQSKILNLLVEMLPCLIMIETSALLVTIALRRLRKRSGEK